MDDGSKQQPGDPRGQHDMTHDQAVDLRSADATAASTPAPTPMPPADPEPTVAADSPYALPDAAPAAPAQSEFAWIGPEFVGHDKSSAWYLGLAGATVLIMALAWLISRDIITQVVIVVCAVLLGFTAARPPREMQFAVDRNGLTIGPKHYPWGSFKSFAIVDEGIFTSIDFLPTKRFAVPLSIYFDPKNESQLLGVLTAHLPFSNHKRTWIDALLHRVHF